MESQKGGADDAASLVAVGDEGAEAEKLAWGEEYRKAEATLAGVRAAPLVGAEGARRSTSLCPGSHLHTVGALEGIHVMSLWIPELPIPPTWMPPPLSPAALGDGPRRRRRVPPLSCTASIMET